MRSFGIGGALVVGASVFYALTFLPAVLGMLGPRVNAAGVASLYTREFYQAVASHLASHPLASNVTYPGLPGSRYAPLVAKYLPRGAGAVFSFDCHGGRPGGQDFIRGVTLWSHLANVGDSKSLIIHPASTTHRQLNDDELRAAELVADRDRHDGDDEAVRPVDEGGAHRIHAEKRRQPEDAA